MKRTLCIFTLLTCLVSTGFSQKLSVKGKINTSDTLKFYITYSSNQIDSMVSPDGSYSFLLTLEEPYPVRLVVVKKDNMRENAIRTFFAQSGEVTINASGIRDFRSTSLCISNPTYNNLYKNYRARFDPLVKMARVLIDRSYDTGRTEPEKKMFRELYETINNIESEVMEQFAVENTDNIVGAFVFSQMQNQLDPQKLDSIYQLFDKNLQHTSYLERMKEKITNMQRLVVGKVAPDFTSVTAKGVPFKLSGLKGKYVVLDFWGSWCIPCIGGIPKMKEYYQKYKKSVEFVSIACKDDDSSWRAAIKKYSLPWTQLLNDEKKKDISLLYNVLGFPTKVIIGKEGNLIASFMGEDEGFYQALDKLLQQ